MAVSNRATKLNKLHRVCKKHYQPVRPPADRSILEHLLYACCLENSDFDQADEAFARLQQAYFDWNEVRVTTVVELAEVMHCLQNPKAAGSRLKKTLHSMFETHYQFDIDQLRKDNLGKAMQTLEKYKGVTRFVVGYVGQNGLGGHSIPVDLSMLQLLNIVGVIDEKEAKKQVVPGMERAIPKNKGVEFFSLVHQLAVAFHAAPFNNGLRSILLEVDPTAKERFPKRVRKTKAVRQKPTDPKSTRKSTKKVAASKPVASKKSPPKKAAKKKAVRGAKLTTKKNAKKTPSRKGSATKTLARRKPR